MAAYLRDLADDRGSLTATSADDLFPHTMDIAFEVTKLIKFSPKRNAIFDKIKEENAAEDDSGVGIRSFCRTRWTVSYGMSVYKIS